MPRFGSRDRQDGPLQLGFQTTWHSDVYHQMLVLPWSAFLGLGAVVYLLLNVLFAQLYMLKAGSIDHARPGVFADAFFFSIQTMATIGYGVLTPVGTYANIIMTVETMVSLVFAAFTTGVTFARFSRPTARVNFSRVAVIAPHNGVPTLTLRLSNARRNQLLEAEVRMTLLRQEQSGEGVWMRRFSDLPLLRSHTPMFALSFTAMHPIDERSPLFGATLDSMAASAVELLVTVTGIDETMSQTIHARTSYGPEDILIGYRFKDMFGFTGAGRVVIDYGRFHEVEAAGGPPVDAPSPGLPGRG